MIKDILLYAFIMILGFKACSLEKNLSMEFDCARFTTMCKKGE